TLVYETHRNEDFVSGARALGIATGARVLHGVGPAIEHGEGVGDGDEQRLGALRLKVLHTPGHTDESISIAIYDTEHGSSAVGVFTGDALFVGDVGRTDFYPDRSEEVARLLWHSIFHKLLPLGDQALLYPAHGAGSVCGDALASREFSSIGYERLHNPRLALSQDEFVRLKVGEHHVFPPYFHEMERLNQSGSVRSEPLPEPQAWTPDLVEQALADDLVLLDLRAAEASAGAGVPGSLALPLSLLSGYVGWLVPYDRPIGLVVDDDAMLGSGIEQLVRLGDTRIQAFLGGGVSAWETSGRPLRSFGSVSVHELRERIDRRDEVTVLDVRKTPEFERGHVPGARHQFLGTLGDWDGIAQLTTPVVTFCSSGKRAILAASILARAGVEDVSSCFGSMEAWRAIDAPVEEGPER
ncbi:MAG TPA: MBL fold metallo-hydrolase, partial [Planctomycetota bacterium]|nr:MBL fold metallo-hydrolase [Planctomycetota bacterium]